MGLFLSAPSFATLGKSVKSFDRLITSCDKASFKKDYSSFRNTLEGEVAKLKSSQQEVVIKVIRPNIESTIHADIELMQALASAVQAWLPDGKRLDKSILFSTMQNDFFLTTAKKLHFNFHFTKTIMLKQVPIEFVQLLKNIVMHYFAITFIHDIRTLSTQFIINNDSHLH